jgi:hypothetical protein
VSLFNSLEQDSRQHVLKPVEISFMDVTFQVVVEGNRVYVPVKPVCESLGISYQHQVRRIRSDCLFEGGVMEIEAAGGKGIFIDLEYVPHWLMTVKVREELRSRLQVYRRDLARVIRDHTLGPGQEVAKLRACLSVLKLKEQGLRRELKELERNRERLLGELDGVLREQESYRAALSEYGRTVEPVAGNLEQLPEIEGMARQVVHVALTDRDREVMSAIYRLKTMAVLQIYRRYFPESKHYCYRRMKELERAGYVISRALVERGRKVGTCYYLGYRGAAELRVRYEPRWVQETWKQPHRVAVSEIFLQAELAGWEWLNSREAKEKYGMNRNSRLEGLLINNGSVYGIYLLDGSEEQKKAVELEIRDQEYELSRFIVLHRRDEWPDVFEDTCGARELLVMPYDAGLEVIKVLPRLDELLQEVLGGHGVKECNRFFARYIGEKDGREFYVAPLLGNDLVMKYYLRRYTVEEAKRDGRGVAVVKLEGQDLGIDPGIYPHVRVVEVPLSMLRRFLERQAGDLR